MYSYPIVLKPDDNGTFLVRFPDVPIAQTFGEHEADAMARAVDALETAFIALIGDRGRIPRPSRPRRGQKTVTSSRPPSPHSARSWCWRSGTPRERPASKRI